MTTGSSANPTSASHTLAAGELLWFGVTIRSTSSITATPTWNGNTMTLSGSSIGTSGVVNYLYYVVAPSGGSSTVTCTQNPSSNWAVATISFTGASATGIPDATSVGGPSTATSYSQSVTSVADNCFAVLYGDNNSGAGLTGGANTTIANQPEVAFTGAFLAYSTAAKTPAGTFTLAFTSAAGTAACCMSSFSPAGGGGGAVYRRLALTGVGN